jgi:hypothetical protein
MTKPVFVQMKRSPIEFPPMFIDSLPRQNMTRWRIPHEPLKAKSTRRVTRTWLFLSFATLPTAVSVLPSQAASTTPADVKSVAPVAASARNNSAQLAAAAGLVPLPNPLYRKGYKLVKNWDFGQTIKTDEQLRAEFFTRYVYEGGKLDTFPNNKEWQRYRDNDNHRLGGSSLKLVAHVRKGWWMAELRAVCCARGGLEKYGYYECRMKVPAGRGLWPPSG